MPKREKSGMDLSHNPPPMLIPNPPKPVIVHVRPTGRDSSKDYDEWPESPQLPPEVLQSPLLRDMIERESKEMNVLLQKKEKERKRKMREEKLRVKYVEPLKRLLKRGSVRDKKEFTWIRQLLQEIEEFREHASADYGYISRQLDLEAVKRLLLNWFIIHGKIKL